MADAARMTTNQVAALLTDGSGLDAAPWADVAGMVQMGVSVALLSELPDDDGNPPKVDGFTVCEFDAETGGAIVAISTGDGTTGLAALLSNAERMYLITQLGGTPNE